MSTKGHIFKMPAPIEKTMISLATEIATILCIYDLARTLMHRAKLHREEIGAGKDGSEI